MAKRGLGAPGTTMAHKQHVGRLGGKASQASGHGYRWTKLQARVMRWRQLAQKERARVIAARLAAERTNGESE